MIRIVAFLGVFFLSLSANGQCEIDKVHSYLVDRDDKGRDDGHHQDNNHDHGNDDGHRHDDDDDRDHDRDHRRHDDRGDDDDDDNHWYNF